MKEICMNCRGTGELGFQRESCWFCGGTGFKKTLSNKDMFFDNQERYAKLNIQSQEMYKVNDIVRYKHPMRIEEKGRILAKLKVIDGIDAGYIDKNVYIISYNELCENDLVIEEQIIEVSK